MNKSKYTYPITQLVKKILLFEGIFFAVCLVLGVVVKALDFKKAWAKDFVPTSMQDSAKELAQNYVNQSLDVSLLHPVYLFILLLIPVYFGIEWGFMRWKNKKIRALGSEQTQAILLPEIQVKPLFWKYIWMRNTVFFLAIALAQPIFGERKVTTNGRNAEILIALDISNSMNVKDISSVDSRLTIAKRSLIQLINSLRGEKIGICVFAGNAYVQLPLTGDYDAAKMYVNEIETDMVSKQGTNIGEALLNSARMYSKAKNSKLLLLVTDGENHEGGIDEAAQLLKSTNIQLAILGLGTKQGGYVPNDPYKPEFGYKILENGKKVVSKLNPKMLAEIAQKANGFAVTSTSSFPDLEKIVNQIRNLKTGESEVSDVEVKENWFQIPLLLGILSLVLYLGVGKLKVESKK
jgi:Ca-activated chloride channel family protein